MAYLCHVFTERTSDMDSFNKVIIGSGLMAEMLLCTLIHHKGESPSDFCIIGTQEERCRKLRKKYNVPNVTQIPEFIASAKVIVLAVDIDVLDDIPIVVENVRPFVSPAALINSLTPKLTIKEIEDYFPEHPVMRLGINLSSISGSGTGVFCCGTKQPADTAPVARFLIETFGDLVEVSSEEEFERVWNVIFAVTCSCYLAMNCFFRTGTNAGISSKQAKEIVLSVFKGAAATCKQKQHEELIVRAFEYENIFKIGLKLLEDYGIEREMHRTMHPDDGKLDFESFLDIDLNEQEKYQVHYRNWV